MNSKVNMNEVMEFEPIHSKIDSPVIGNVVQVGKKATEDLLKRKISMGTLRTVMHFGSQTRESNGAKTFMIPWSEFIEYRSKGLDFEYALGIQVTVTPSGYVRSVKEVFSSDQFPSGKLHLTKHARERMVEREISCSKLVAAIEHGRKRKDRGITFLRVGPREVRKAKSDGVDITCALGIEIRICDGTILTILNSSDVSNPYNPPVRKGRSRRMRKAYRRERDWDELGEDTHG
jgi:hypothetical protein